MIDPDRQSPGLLPPPRDRHLGSLFEATEVAFAPGAALGSLRPGLSQGVGAAPVDGFGDLVS